MKFAHNSEKLFSEHLDLFNIQWIYEPTSFPLKWGRGAIKMMFTPDFYLPTLNTYIEITDSLNKEPANVSTCRGDATGWVRTRGYSV